MAQPNANREPTMEEILASIRRIIENNELDEDRRSQSGSGAVDEVASALEEEMAGPDGFVGSDEDEARDTIASVAAAPVQRADSRPVSLAEVAARVRASGSSAALLRPSAPAVASAHGNAAVRIEEEPDLPEDLREEPVEDWSVAAEEAVESRPEAGIETAAAQDEDEEACAAAVEPAPEDEMEKSEMEAALESELESVLEFAESALPTPMDDEPERPSPRHERHAGRRESDSAVHLISASAGAKVAAAFGDLNEAFAAGSRRSFDEMAEEMLRPMLQQWLDDNLPTLVERLVREEIERVARGDRR